MLGRARNTLRERWFVHFDFLIVCKPLGASPPEHPGFTLIEHRRDSGSVERLYRSFGRDLTSDRVQRRFDAGLRFFELRRDGKPLASTWAVAENERFVDELGIGIRVGSGMLWLRDIFVADSERGRGIFSVLLDEVQRPFPEARSLWSALIRSSRASVLAHQRYGHEVVSRYELLHLFGRVMFRLRWPRELPVGSAFRDGRRVLFTGESYRKFCLDRLA